MTRALTGLLGHDCGGAPAFVMDWRDVSRIVVVLTTRVTYAVPPAADTGGVYHRNLERPRRGRGRDIVLESLLYPLLDQLIPSTKM